jgi:hypothetical protein
MRKIKEKRRAGQHLAKIVAGPTQPQIPQKRLSWKNKCNKIGGWSQSRYAFLQVTNSATHVKVSPLKKFLFYWFQYENCRIPN